DQERWDVVAYIMTLHTSEEEIQRGKELFEEACSDCSTEYFKDQDQMSALSTVALARIVRLGNEEIPAFGENLSDEDMWAVAEYLRSLSYDSQPLTVQTQPTPFDQTQDKPVPATRTPAASDAGTQSAEGTPSEAEQAQVTDEATPVPVQGFGSVSGSIENKTGSDLPSDLTITLRGFEHDFANPNAGTQEVLTLTGSVNSDGTFAFENVEMPENRIFLAEANYKGVEIASGFVIVEAGQTSITLPPLALYDVTDDTSMLTVDELDMFFSAQNEGSYDVIALYTFRNASGRIVSVSMGTAQEIPFLKFPEGAQGLGYEAVQDSARFISTDDGFAMAPSEQSYGILAYSSLARQKETQISQPLVLPVSLARIFVPDGMKVEGNRVTQEGAQSIQGLTYQTYSITGLNAGEKLTFTVSGSPNDAASDENASAPNNALLIGAGGLGVALILAGAWMYLRDRRQTGEEDEEEEEFESSEDVMDAIIALDDLYRARKIPEEAYQKRRSELKDILKELI
ncbi:MAG: cytochrome c, partial [Anaerolineales bacterium]|nr:cytochrome c [Anaerolineales bacterium]